MKFKVIKESKDTKIEVENPGLLEVPKGKKVYDLPVSHFKKLIDKKGREKIIRAITNLEVWNKNDDPKIASWAKKMKKSLEGYGEKKTKNESLKEGWHDELDIYSRTDWKDIFVVVDLERLALEAAFSNQSDADNLAIRLEEESGRRHDTIRTQLYK